MYNHEPEGYICPFCLAAQGIENDKVQTKQDDIFYKDELVMAFIASSGWVNNPGHILVIPIKHYENLYDIPKDTNHQVTDLVQRAAIALKEIYQCPGTTIRQHNEPDGGQDVWHYHVQVFPRYEGDQLYQLINERKLTPPEERKPFADKLREYFSKK